MATSFAFATYPETRSPPARRKSALPTGKLAAFASLSAPIAAVQVPLGNFLPAIYAQHFGISLAALGTIFLAERLWGTFSDPLIGALSDRTSSRFGRRRPWIVSGVAVFALAVIALFFPLAGVSPLYLAAALFTCYLGWSMIQIPYYAWSGEVTVDYHERTRVATYVGVASAAGLVPVLLLPTLIDQVRPGDDALRLAGMGAAVLAMLLPGAWLALRSFPEALAAPGPRPERIGPIETLRLVLREKLLLRVLLSDTAVSFGQGVRGALFLFVVTIYLGQPKLGSLLMLSQFAVGIAAGPIWMTIAKRFGKHRTAITGELVQVAINLGLLAIAPNTLWLLIGLTIAQGLAQGSGNLMLRAMVADIADQHQLATGHDQKALFFSAFSLSMKAGMALAIGVALPLVGAAGFNPAAAHNSSQALHVLLLVFALGPALAHLLSAALLRGFPLDEAAHVAVRRELDRRAAIQTA